MDSKILQSSLIFLILVILNTLSTDAQSSEPNKLTLNCTYSAQNPSVPNQLTCKLNDLNLVTKELCTRIDVSTFTSYEKCVSEKFVNFSGTDEEKRNTVTVWFQNSNVRIIPWTIVRDFPNLEELRIRNQNSSTVEKSVFQNLTSLKRLSLANYEGIETGAFTNLTKLEVLDLSSNYFEGLPPNVFQKNMKLKKLLLNDNNLEQFNESFVKHLRDLELIDLSENQDIKISPNSFQNNTKLKELRLSGIRLEKIEEKLFEKLVNLEVIDLSTNFLTNVPKTLFQNNLKLKEIYLSGNQIKDLDKDIFKNLQDLEKVKLNSNSLTEIDPEYFEGNKKLSYLDIRFNNLTEFDKDSFAAAIPSLNQLYAPDAGHVFQCLSFSVILLISLSTFLL